ncbi:hypothetical protein ACIQNU_04285 [Streptomyces sp. NPDC091292]|uniref:hypothetical protein n=1 Tax=Streptomyces sp. NPDC091292 TaxID=3365991 RepID=UPI00380F7163
MPTATLTDADVVRRYAAEIAYVAEAPAPATDLESFIDQLDTAVRNFAMAQMQGHEDLETALTLLAEARDSDAPERPVFLKRADELLTPVWDMADEYRLMVDDGDEEG